MKTSLFIFVFFLGLFSPSLTKVREDYKNAFNSKEVTLQLNKDLAEVKKTDENLLVAYKGAVLTLMAKHSKITKEKKIFFKEGATLINFAINEQPTNVEMRCIRLGVQENTPKLLKYRANKTEDKQLIKDQFENIKSNDVKKYVRGFIMQSKSFSDEEKKHFN
tara:strand:- start:17021 stop:17509 length:489 start_codon:yes stop_codon:yes gene_type:complete